ncbi:MscL family protein [Candidatus Woesearchaeota archaeon]|nr:MscL family protein [Candidatus Woesearchaeota archaeon]
MGIFKEFADFLKEYKVVGLAVAFIIGAASTSLVKSLVNNIIMPMITPFVPEGAWRTAKLTMGPFILGWGEFLSELINFLIIAAVVFIIAKAILKEQKVAKK